MTLLELGVGIFWNHKIYPCYLEQFFISLELEIAGILVYILETGLDLCLELLVKVIWQIPW